MRCPQVVPEGTQRECDELAELEWKSESKGKTTMDFEDFCESLVLSVRLWCDGSSASKHIQFAAELFKGLTDHPWHSVGDASELSPGPSPSVQLVHCTVEEAIAQSEVRGALDP